MWLRIEEILNNVSSCIYQLLVSVLACTVVGDDALEVYNNFCFQEQDDKIKLDKILKNFEAYCILKRNVTFGRHKSFTCVQKIRETVDQYVTELRNRSKTCEFRELTNLLKKHRR